jgi:hypothetical protein
MRLPPRAADEEQETRRWLGVLRAGTREQKIEARAALARIFEARGRPDQAIGLLESSARAGVRDPALFARLAALYRRAGRDDDAAAAMAELIATLKAPPMWPPPATRGRGPARSPAPVPSQQRGGRRTTGGGRLGWGLAVLLLAAVGALVGAGAGSRALSPPAVDPARAAAAAAPATAEQWARVPAAMTSGSMALPTVGDAVEGDPWVVALRRVGTAAVLQNVLGEKRAQGRFILVTMRVTNRTQQPAALDAGDFRLVMADGTPHRASTAGRAALQGEPRPIILTEQIPPAQSRDLREVFDVDPATTDAILEAPGGARFRMTLP